jgi:hypothetical protein
MMQMSMSRRSEASSFDSISIHIVETVSGGEH